MFYWAVTTPDGEHIEVKSAEDFYFRHDDAVNTDGVSSSYYQRFPHAPFRGHDHT
jgi:hypothetical protein